MDPVYVPNVPNIWTCPLVLCGNSPTVKSFFSFHSLVIVLNYIPIQNVEISKLYFS